MKKKADDIMIRITDDMNKSKSSTPIPIKIIFGAIYTFILFVVIVLIMQLSNNISEAKECRLENPDRKFCHLVKEGIDCGFKCEELDMDFYHFELGGNFAISKCVCSDASGYPHTMY